MQHNTTLPDMQEQQALKSNASMQIRLNLQARMFSSAVQRSSQNHIRMILIPLWALHVVSVTIACNIREMMQSRQ